LNRPILRRSLQLPGETAVLIVPEARNCHVLRWGPLFLICLVLAGCGGKAGSSPAPAPTVTTATASVTPAPAPSLPAARPQPGTPNVVAVSGGQSVSGVDITVAPPASSNPANAQNLGVNSPTGQGMASNTGGSIHRGSAMRVLLFGPGLNNAMTVKLSGPSDVTISSIQGISATDNTPGIAFIATVSANAALGARTVYLQNPNGDMTSFAGGLEVLP